MIGKELLPDSESTGVPWWLQEMTPEQVERGRQLRATMQETRTLREQATPTHPDTGEKGRFSRYTGNFPHVRAVYITESGKEFSLAD